MTSRHYCFAAFALLVLVFFGCAAPHRPLATHYRIEIDPSFPDYAVPAIVDAAESWKVAAPGLTLDVVISQCSLEPEAICVAPVVAMTAHPGKVGWTDEYPAADDATITVLPTHANVEMTKIVAHEFGHAMGLSHDVPGTVMCEDVNCAANKVTCGDVAQFWRVRGGPAAFAHACGVAPTNP